MNYIDRLRRIAEERQEIEEAIDFLKNANLSSDQSYCLEKLINAYRKDIDLGVTQLNKQAAHEVISPHPMDGSVSITLSIMQLEELLYENDKAISIPLDVDGVESEIIIKKGKEWK